MAKVGITALERGSARLLEQGAVCFSWLGAGPLMAARRTEELLRAALGVPDRIPYADKRAVRSGLPESAAERAAEVTELHARAVALAAWPESLERAPCQVVDHVEVFGLAGVPAAVGSVTELAPGGVVSGRLVAAAGPDLHLATGVGATGAGVTAAGATGGGATGSGATGVGTAGVVGTATGATGTGPPATGATGTEPPATGATGTGPPATGATGTEPPATGVTEPRETVVVLDTRLMTGWELLPVEADELTVPVKEFMKAVAVVQDGLF
ncbi:DUF2797 domain-containing protein [Streptomyces sp. NBC_00289]|uniref:DUF2797 domain-containing protein n=1 Tax=Streptomyces sp. NBC_00289 TaxID=2975703 RepID=UPI00324B6FD0